MLPIDEGTKANEPALDAIYSEVDGHLSLNWLLIVVGGIFLKCQLCEIILPNQLSRQSHSQPP